MYTKCRRPQQGRTLKNAIKLTLKKRLVGVWSWFNWFGGLLWRRYWNKTHGILPASDDH